jgi:mono/diheme cytochrome c family protein
MDLYWRIAKGINGAKMPAHHPTIEPERVWDVVNFVLALPYEPALLDGATLPTTPIPALAPAVARR